MSITSVVYDKNSIAAKENHIITLVKICIVQVDFNPNSIIMPFPNDALMVSTDVRWGAEHLVTITVQKGDLCFVTLEEFHEKFYMVRLREMNCKPLS